MRGNTLCLRYTDEPVNVVQGKNRCLLWELYKTQGYSVSRTQNFDVLM
jgi:hypothetical protein